MTSSLQLVTEQFPLVRDRVASLFESDDVFRELCDDYETCSQALGRQAANEGLQRELGALRLRLETELLRYVQDVERLGIRK
jgi:hypothetical protein